LLAGPCRADRVPHAAPPTSSPAGKTGDELERRAALRWFRHYPGLARDEKLAAVALASGQPIERVVWLWVVLLEDAAERNADDGYFSVSLPACAWFLHCEPAELEAIMAALDAAGRIFDGCRISAWPARQYIADRSTARVRAYRARKSGNGHETGVKRQ